MKPGDTLDRYTLHEVLGKGQLSTVFAAERRGFPTRVALKVLNTDATLDQQYAERFLEDARTAFALNHPNLVKVYDARAINGIFFIEMEYIDGASLKEMIQFQDISIDTVLRIASDVADGLSYVHAYGYIHRDVKPSNIVIDSATRVAKLTDFSSVKNWNDRDLNRTVVGQIIGTPRYMAPEQFQGRPIDARADIFALGTTLFESISGQSPFRGNTIAEVFHSIANSPRPDVRQLRPDVPEVVASYITSMLSAEPQERPHFASDVRNDLRFFADRMDALLSITAAEGAQALEIAQKSKEMFAPLGPPHPVTVTTAAEARKERSALRSPRSVIVTSVLFTLAFVTLYAVWLVPFFVGTERAYQFLAGDAQAAMIIKIGNRYHFEIHAINPLVDLVHRVIVGDGPLSARSIVESRMEIDYVRLLLGGSAWLIALIFLLGLNLGRYPITKRANVLQDHSERNFFLEQLVEIEQRADGFRRSAAVRLMIGFIFALSGLAFLMLLDRSTVLETTGAAAAAAFMETLALFFFRQWWPLHCDAKEFFKLRLEKAEQYREFLRMKGDELDPDKTAVMASVSRKLN